MLKNLTYGGYTGIIFHCSLVALQTTSYMGLYSAWKGKWKVQYYNEVYIGVKTDGLAVNRNLGEVRI